MRLREHAAIRSKLEAFRVDPRELHVTEGYNGRDWTTRDNIEALLELKEEIREEGGVHTPLQIRQVGGELHIVSGHRRHRAVMELIAEGMEIKSVPAVAEEPGVSDAERILRLKTQNSGKQLTMLELAENVVRRLLAMGWSDAEIANRMGYKTEASIQNFKLLLSAAQEVKEAVKSGEIAPSTAVELVRKEGSNAAAKLPVIREAAKARGKGKASIRDVAATPKGNADPYLTEQRNLKRITEHLANQNQDVAAVQEVLATLNDLSKRGVKPADIVGQLVAETAQYEIAEQWINRLSDAHFKLKGA